MIVTFKNTHVQYTQIDTVCQTIITDSRDRQRLKRSTYGPLMICTSMLGEACERLTILTDCTDLQRLRRSVYGLLMIGVLNGPIHFKSGRRIWPLLEWLPKITWVLQNFCKCSHGGILVSMCSIARNLGDLCFVVILYT